MATHEDIAALQAFFLRGMVAGWASNAPKTQIDALPGFRLIPPYEEGNCAQ
jgi:hypothetical protein